MMINLVRARKNSGGKGQQQSASGQNGNHNNHDNGGKRKHPDDGSYFVANTNTRYKNQHHKGKQPYNRVKPKNYEDEFDIEGS